MNTNACCPICRELPIHSKMELHEPSHRPPAHHVISSHPGVSLSLVWPPLCIAPHSRPAARFSHDHFIH